MEKWELEIPRVNQHSRKKLTNCKARPDKKTIRDVIIYTFVEYSLLRGLRRWLCRFREKSVFYDTID